MGVQVEFLEQVCAGDPSQRPCIILGKKTNLQSLPYSSVLEYLGDKVTEEVKTTPHADSAQIWSDLELIHLQSWK